MGVFEDSMLINGKVKKEIEITTFGRTYLSRGFYIVDTSNNIMHLHHDGKVKDGVAHDSDRPAFWDTEKEAQEFLDNWITENTPEKAEG